MCGLDHRCNRCRRRGRALMGMSGVRGARRKSLVLDTVLVAAGRYSQFLIAVVSLPLISHHLGLAEFGLYAIGTAAYFFGTAMGDCGLAQRLVAVVSTTPDITHLRRT